MDASSETTPALGSSRAPRRYVLGVLLLAVSGFVLYRYVLISEEERVRRMVDKGAEAVEEQSLRRCAGLVSRDYSDSNGFDRRTLLDAARRMFESFTKIEVQIADLSFDQPPVKVAGGESEEWRAQVRLRLSVKFYDERGVAELIDEDRRAKQFVLLSLIKRSGRWQLQKMEFENVDILNYGMY